jgi:hypothetical protein
MYAAAKADVRRHIGGRKAMPLTLYRRPGSDVWHYRGTLAGHRLRGSTGTSNKENAQRAAAKVEDAFFKRGHAEKEEGLTWPKAVALYM